MKANIALGQGKPAVSKFKVPPSDDNPALAADSVVANVVETNGDLLVRVEYYPKNIASAR